MQQVQFWQRAGIKEKWALTALQKEETTMVRIQHFLHRWSSVMRTEQRKQLSQMRTGTAQMHL